MPDSSVVVVGGSLGGLRTAESLRRFGFTGDITVIGDEPHLPYNRPPLSKDFLASRMNDDELSFPLRDAISDISWVLGTKAVAADLSARTVTSADGRIFSFDSLVVATGLRPKRLAIPGSDLPECFALRTMDNAVALRSALRSDARVVVVGAGFIGCEVAATVRGLGNAVTVIGRDEFPMERPLGPVLAAELMRRNEARGVRFAMRSRVKRILGDGHVTGVLLDDGSAIECDVVVEAVGSLRNTEWLDGNDVDVEHGVRTDTAMRALRRDGTPWPSVFAVGDVARFPNGLFGDAAATVEHWNIPTETARRAASVITASAQGPEALARSLSARFEPIPSFWSDQFDVHLLAYGMLAHADRIELLHGERSGDCVFGYFLDGKLVGVCGIGSRSVLMQYRVQLGHQAGSSLEDDIRVGGSQ